MNKFMKNIFRCIVSILLFSLPLPVHAETCVTAEIPVKEEGRSGTAVLESENGQLYSSLSIPAQGCGTFAVSFTEPDSYTFTIHQSTVESGAAKDNKTYRVFVIVTESDSGELKPVVLIYREDVKVSSAVFNNKDIEEKEEISEQENKNNNETPDTSYSASVNKKDDGIGALVLKRKTETAADQDGNYVGDSRQKNRHTGDDSRLLFYLCAVAAADGLVIFIVLKMRKTRN